MFFVNSKLITVAIAISLYAAPQVVWAQDPTDAPPSDLTVSAMFAQADWIVKIVIIGLLLASLACWTIFLAKILELRARNRRARHVKERVGELTSLEQAREDAELKSNFLIQSVTDEMTLSGDLLDDGAGVKERILSRYERHQAKLSKNMTRGISSLATIGSTAPFVGLFGTVWGIMNSFIGIAETQTTSLAVVAPGIAEALLATALGLVAAIPAVVMYNYFTRQITGHLNIVDDTAAAILRLASRDLSRAQNRG